METFDLPLDLQVTNGVLTMGNSEEVVENDIGKLFQDCIDQYALIVDENNLSPLRQFPSENDADIIIRSISLIEKCSDVANKSVLISKNDTLDDIGTSTLKYISLNYLRGKMALEIKDLSIRKSWLLNSIAWFEMFAETCFRLELVSDKEVEENNVDAKKLNDEGRRNLKVAKYKREKALKDRMKLLEDIIQAQSEDIDIPMDIEEELREYWISKLKYYLWTSLDEIPMIKQEIELLTMMESRRQQDPQGPLPFSNSSTTSGLPPSYPPPPVPSKSTGIEVTRFFKVGDQVLSKRELVKSTVFTPSMAAPTVSVEEYGDYLLDQMQQQQRQQQQDQQQKLMDGIDDRPIRKYKQLEQDGDEDNEDLVDLATQQDRVWDDFKEANPRGWGNKMGKRY